MSELEQLMHDVDSSVRTFAAANMSRRTNSGIPAHPEVTVEESTLEIGRTNLQMDGTKPQAVAAPGLGVITGPTGACCVGGLCAITSEAACIALGGTYMGDGTLCSPDPC